MDIEYHYDNSNYLDVNEYGIGTARNFYDNKYHKLIESNYIMNLIRYESSYVKEQLEKRLSSASK